jgi:dTDP-4-dehydrorhamnose reductase
MPAMMLILGAGGMLGHQMWLQLGETQDVVGTLRLPHARLQALTTSRRRLHVGIDARDLPRIETLLEVLRPAAVVNCVGVVKQLPKGQDPETCIQLNSLFPHQLSRLCAAAGIRLIHISTDCVFSGRRGGYREEDEPDAEDFYGRSKALGEVTGRGALTLRTSIIGHELRRGRSLLEWFLAREGEAAGYAGARWNGLTTVELARVVRDRVLARPELEGLYHVASAPLCKDELLRRIAAVYGLGTVVKSQAEPVSDHSLDGSRFAAATGWRVPEWGAMLAELREEWLRRGELYQ